MREYLSDKQIKSELTALLQVVHEFLVEHNIKYTITAGTLLGAVRHKVSAKYCYAAHESRLHQNDRCKRFTLCLVLTVRFRSLAPWGKLFQLFI